MRLKQSIGDFRVRELLQPGVLLEKGPHRVYRVMKRKLTSLEAAAALASEAGVSAGDVALVGMKDRQGITQQYMSIERGRDVRVRTPSLRIEPAGFAERELAGYAATGNAFEIVARALDPDEKRALRRNLDKVRACGFVNYFDEQRFGNLRHNQGWIARQLIEGDVEGGLRRLLCAPSIHDDGRTQTFKHALDQGWGDWDRCHDAGKRFGAHHSLFRHLQQHPGDFAGAFKFVASRIRLIHLFAYQSHLWNRAVADYLRGALDEQQRIVLPGPDGRLVHPEIPLPPEVHMDSFRLPGPGLEDVTDPRQRACFEAVLERQELTPERLRIDGISGFALKGEDRDLLIRPRHLRVRPAEPDTLNRGLDSVKLRFELPRGAYATLLVQRLLAGAHKEARPAGDFGGRDRDAEDDRREGGGAWRAGADRGDRGDRGRGRPRSGRYAGGGERSGGGGGRWNDDRRAGGRAGSSGGREQGAGRPWTPRHGGESGEGRPGSYRRDDDRGRSWDDRQGRGSGSGRPARGDRDERGPRTGGGRGAGARGPGGDSYRGGDRNRGGDSYRGGDRNRGGDSYRGGDRNRGGDSYRGGDRNRGGDSYRGGDRNRGGDSYRGSDRSRGGDSHRGGDRDRGGDRSRGGEGYRGGDRNRGGDPNRGGGSHRSGDERPRRPWQARGEDSRGGGGGRGSEGGRGAPWQGGGGGRGGSSQRGAPPWKRGQREEPGRGPRPPRRKDENADGPREKGDGE